MNVEERVRQALQHDAARVEVPARPDPAALASERRSSGWRVAVLVAAATAVVLAIIGVGRPFGLSIDPVDPVDPPPSAPPPSWSFDADSPDVFAAGATDGGVSWFAAAALVDDRMWCAGIRFGGASSHGATGCSSRRPLAPIQVTVARDGQGTVAVVGTVTADDAVVAVWELPDGPVELELHDLPDLGARGFAGAAEAVTGVTMIWLYDEAGQRLAGTGLSSEVQPDPAGQTQVLEVGHRAGVRPAFLEDGTPVFVVIDGDVLVLDAVSPHQPNGLRKALVWCPGSERFVDPWHGSKFTRDGTWLTGPAPTGMARYDARRSPDGDTVELGARLMAPPRPSDTATGEHDPAGRACETDRSGHVEGPVVSHAPPPGAPASPEEASGSEIVYVSAAVAAWDGATQQPDGTVDTSGFEQYVNDMEPPPDDPIEVALLLFDLTHDDVDETETDPTQGSGTRITLLSHIETDDSVASLRRQVTLERAPDGRWTVVETSWDQRCRPGRGHQDYSPEPCV